MYLLEININIFQFLIMIIVVTFKTQIRKLYYFLFSSIISIIIIGKYLYFFTWNHIFSSYSNTRTKFHQEFIYSLIIWNIPFRYRHWKIRNHESIVINIYLISIFWKIQRKRNSILKFIHRNTIMRYYFIVLDIITFSNKNIKIFAFIIFLLNFTLHQIFIQKNL